MASKPVEHAPIVCAAPDCEVEFTPKRGTARYHSATCQRRASRSRKAAAHQAAAEAKGGTDAEHGLVKAVRLQLEKAQVLDTVNGQLALELARRAVSIDSNLVSMSKELDARLKAAISTTPAAADAPADPAPVEDDDVTKARARRDRKRAAAGEA